jgi:hypothetical protein
MAGFEQREADVEADGGSSYPSPTAHYSPNEERPLAPYLILTGAYGAAFAGSLLALRARGRELPERLTTADVLLIGVATHKLSRLIAKDKVTSFLRAPFTRFQESSGHGEVEEEPCGHGLRLAVGELLVCPYCLAQWVATGLTVGLIGAPRVTRVLSTVFVAHTVSDFLQAAYSAAEDRL